MSCSPTTSRLCRSRVTLQARSRREHPRPEGGSVRRWRLAVAVILALVIGLPLALPFLDLLRHPAAWRAWGEWGRLFVLARGTLLLVVGTLALVLPVGLVAAVLLYRTD